MYIARFNWDAQCDEEVSFKTGDRIVDAVSISDEWMIATVERTKKRGRIEKFHVFAEIARSKCLLLWPLLCPKH